MGVTLRGAAVTALLMFGSAGCGLNLPHSRAPSVSLRMRGTPPEATVTIDDHFVGPLDVVAARGVALPKGSHRISVEADGYFPWDKQVDARDKPVEIEVRLTAIPD
jgi:hypothetical protein